jgi:hypothetical protein
MEHFPTTMLNHEEHEQDSQPDSRNGEEIDRYDLTEVVAKERFPGLGWRWSPNTTKKP